MNTILFATHNENKLHEVKKIIGDKYKIISLNDIEHHTEIPETQDTIEGNASQKTNFIYDLKGIDCFSDDTGLEVEALKGAPGVYSARYAGPRKNDSDNLKKLLKELGRTENRKARFKTVVSLILNKKEYLFEGIINGNIAFESKGKNGFGYDPVFIPEGYTKSFAEIDSKEKNIISHRALAVKKLTEFLSKQ